MATFDWSTLGRAVSQEVAVAGGEPSAGGYAPVVVVSIAAGTPHTGVMSSKVTRRLVGGAFAGLLTTTGAAPQGPSQYWS